MFVWLPRCFHERKGGLDLVARQSLPGKSELGRLCPLSLPPSGTSATLPPDSLHYFQIRFMRRRVLFISVQQFTAQLEGLMHVPAKDLRERIAGTLFQRAQEFINIVINSDCLAHARIIHEQIGSSISWLLAYRHTSRWIVLNKQLRLPLFHG